MNSMRDRQKESAAAAPGIIHRRWVRIQHWINAVAIIVMVGSGWEIYNASPIFDFVFPKSATIGGWLGGAILWHFAAMWVLMINGLIYVLLGLTTGHLRSRFLPIRPGEIIRDTVAALRGKLSHDDLASYNAVQKVSYCVVLLAGVLVVATGFAVWKPVQLQWLTAIFGGFDNARLWHFIAMAVIVLFVLVHVTMALLVPKSLRAMIRGY